MCYSIKFEEKGQEIINEVNKVLSKKENPFAYMCACVFSQKIKDCVECPCDNGSYCASMSVDCTETIYQFLLKNENRG